MVQSKCAKEHSTHKHWIFYTTEDRIMKRSLTAFIGIVLMLAMTLALVGCNKKTDETVTVTAAAPTVVTQQVEEAT